MRLEDFPSYQLRAGQVLYRIHRAANSPWWFSAGEGRFDPKSGEAGSCYFAAHPLGAWVEVFRKTMAVSEAMLNDRRLFTVDFDRDLRLADLSHRRAAQFGVDASLSAGLDYGPSQALAERFYRAGFDGIRYLVRHDPAQKLYGIAIFGPPGVPSPAKSWPAGADAPIPDDLAEEACELFGYRVLPKP